MLVSTNCSVTKVRIDGGHFEALVAPIRASRIRMSVPLGHLDSRVERLAFGELGAVASQRFSGGRRPVILLPRKG
jgi:hypothetical protein